MGLRIAAVSIDGASITALAKAALVESTSERPVPLPLFESPEDAADFLDYAEREGFFVSRMSPESLERLRVLWMQEAGQ